MKTSEVKSLVSEVLESLPVPYTEHVIEDVFCAIERSPEWRREYDALVSKLSRDVVNNWCGRWTSILLGKGGERQVQATRSKLIGSYSLLDTDRQVTSRKPKEAEALQLLWDYYGANKASLSPDIGKRREQIVELLMEGIPVADAFALASST